MSARTTVEPSLRFPQFSSSWEQTTVGGLGEVVTGSTPPTDHKEYYGGDYPFFAPSDILEGGGILMEADKTLSELGFSMTRQIRSGATLFVCIGSTIGKVGKTVVLCATNQQINAVVPDGDNDDDFVHFAMVRAAPKIRELTAVQAVPIINKTTFSREKLFKPYLAEQQKIAAFLSAVDEKIAQLTRKKALLEDYKKGCMQQLFSQKIRFKDDQGNEFPDWEEKRLSEVFEEVSERVGERSVPTFSITARRGFVSQEEKFGRDISGRQNEHYTVLSPGDFSYNKGNSKTYFYGCVYENIRSEQIAVPNVFISFRKRNSDDCSGYFGQLFEAHYLDRHLRRIISSSARMDGLLNVSKEHFFKIQIPVPHPKEQQKISDFLAGIDRKIDLAETELQLAKTFKKGLLQQMFV